MERMKSASPRLMGRITGAIYLLAMVTGVLRPGLRQRQAGS